ncbi:TPA: hypothetical protein ACL51T_002077, partial [Streptococcus pneumoniae]
MLPMLRIRNLNNILLRYINFQRILFKNIGEGNMRFYCEAYEVITEEKKVSFFYVDEKPLRYLLFDYIFLLVLAKKKYPNLMNCTPKVRF